MKEYNVYYRWIENSYCDSYSIKAEDIQDAIIKTLEVLEEMGYYVDKVDICHVEVVADELQN